jgi:hypothetical protein
MGEPARIMQGDGLLVDEDHVPEGMDVGSGRKRSGFRDERVVDEDHVPVHLELELHTVQEHAEDDHQDQGEDEYPETLRKNLHHHMGTPPSMILIPL